MELDLHCQWKASYQLFNFWKSSAIFSNIGVKLYIQSQMREAPNFSMINEKDLSSTEGLWC